METDQTNEERRTGGTTSTYRQPLESFVRTYSFMKPKPVSSSSILHTSVSSSFFRSVVPLTKQHSMLRENKMDKITVEENVLATEQTDRLPR